MKIGLYVQDTQLRKWQQKNSTKRERERENKPASMETGEVHLHITNTNDSSALYINKVYMGKERGNFVDSISNDNARPRSLLTMSLSA